jgi:ribonuclease HII
LKNAANNYWNLKAIDSLEDSDDLPSEERKKLIDQLIDNQEIKDIIITDNDNNDKFDALNAKPSLDIEQQRQRQRIKRTKRTKCQNNNHKSNLKRYLYSETRL